MRWPIFLFAVSCLASNPPAWEGASSEEALFLRRIADFWEEGEYALAKRQIEGLLDKHPNSPWKDALRSALGDLYVREGAYTQALEQYGQIGSKELQEEKFLQRAEALYQVGWYATLSDLCQERLSQIDPSSSQKTDIAYYGVISLYQQMLGGGHSQEELQKLYAKAKPWLEDLLSSSWKEEISPALAHMHALLGEYEEGARLYESLALSRPEEEDKMAFQAALLWGKVDPKKGALAFGALSEKGGDKRAHATYNELALLFEAKDFEAIIAKKSTWALHLPQEKIPSLHLFLGRSYLAKEEFAKASEEILLFLDTEPLLEKKKGALVALVDSAFYSDDMSTLQQAISLLQTHFPDAEELPKALFCQALLWKKDHHIEETKKQLAHILSLYPSFQEAPEAMFELAHLEYQSENWEACHAKAEEFLSHFPSHPLAPHAWRHLISAAIETATTTPLQERLLLDITRLLESPLSFTPQEASDWNFLLCKTLFDLHRYEEASKKAREVLDTAPSFSQKGATYLVAALAEKELSHKDNFVIFGEKALQEDPQLPQSGDLHIALFNSYLENESLVDKGAMHLLSAFEKGKPIAKENLSWLSRYLLDKKDLSLAPSLCTLLQHLTQIEQDPLMRESYCIQLGGLYLATSQPLLAKELLSSLRVTQENGDVLWQKKKEATLLQAEAFLALGDTLLATPLLESLVQERALLYTPWGAKGALHLAQIYSQEKREDALLLCKDLVLQKTLSNEPLHLQAALLYIDLAASSLPKRVELLEKMASEFQKEEDLLSKDYHGIRRSLPEKNRLWEGYMRWIQADLAWTRSLLSPDASLQKELQAKGKELLLQIVEENIHQDLCQRAEIRLHDANGK